MTDEEATAGAIRLKLKPHLEAIKEIGDDALELGVHLQIYGSLVAPAINPNVCPTR